MTVKKNYDGFVLIFGHLFIQNILECQFFAILFSVLNGVYIIVPDNLIFSNLN